MAANDHFNPMPANSHLSDRRMNAEIRPLPISQSSYSAYKPEHPANTDSPISPSSDPRSPSSPIYRQTSLLSPTDSRSPVDSRFYGAGGGGRTSESGLYREDIPLTSPLSPPGNGMPKQQPYEADPSLPGPAQAPRRKRRREQGGWFRGKIPWVVYIFTLAQLTVFIAEIVRNSILTGSPIQIHPQVNPMLGPSIYVLINMGARYVPCMKSVDKIQNSDVAFTWPCPNTTSDDVRNPTNQCQLSDLCGFSEVPNPLVGGSLDDTPQPNQWYRFILPIFLHAGIVHIAFNMLLQLTLGREMEKEIGSIRFLIVYLSAGIFGFVMGGNFAPSGVASTGASGSLFGVIALMLLDLLYTWKERPSPVKDLIFIVIGIIISFVLGLLPGLDNFSHIGGFLMGLVLGVCILRSPHALRQRVGAETSPYSPMSTKTSAESGMKAFAKQPMHFFTGRKPLWWGWWLVRAVALIGVLVCFIVLLNNFYKYRQNCSWCKYLSCLPVKNWCDVGNIQLSTTNGTTSKRDLFGVMASSMDLPILY